MRGEHSVFAAFYQRTSMLRALAQWLLPRKILRRESVTDVMGRASVDILEDTRKGKVLPHGMSYTQYFCRVVRDTVKSVIRWHEAIKRDIDKEVHMGPAGDGYGASSDAPNLGDLQAKDTMDLGEPEEVAWMLNQLPPQDREVIELRILKGWTTKEYARAMQIDEGAARQRLLRALKRARDVLRDKGPDA